MFARGEPTAIPSRNSQGSTGQGGNWSGCVGKEGMTPYHHVREFKVVSRNNAWTDKCSSLLFLSLPLALLRLYYAALSKLGLHTFSCFWCMKEDAMVDACGQAGRDVFLTLSGMLPK